MTDTKTPGAGMRQFLTEQRPFSPCLAVREGIPADDALDAASCFLAVAIALPDANDPAAIESVEYVMRHLMTAAKALLDAAAYARLKGNSGESSHD